MGFKTQHEDLRSIAKLHKPHVHNTLCQATELVLFVCLKFCSRLL